MIFSTFTVNLHLFRVLMVTGMMALLAGCASSAPVRYYTLQAPAGAAESAAPFPFALQVVRVPAQVDVAPLVVRQGDAALSVLEGHQWGAPLALEWRGALSTALRYPHGGIDLARAGIVLAPDVPILRVDLQRFDSQTSVGVQVAGVWSVSQTEPAVTLSCAFELESPSGDLPADIATAHQQLVARLATEIAATLTRLRSGGAATCGP